MKHMIKINLYDDEAKLIYMIRKSRPNANFKVDKRPTALYPLGEITHVDEELSWQFKDIKVDFQELLEDFK